MKSLLCLFAILSSALAFETCEECMDHVVAFGGLITDSKEAITTYLTTHYCPDTDDPDCANHVDQLYPDMLSLVVDEFIILANWQICQQVNACNRTVAVRELTCSDCIINLDNIREHLTGRDHITEMEHWLERHYCTDAIPNCPQFLRRHFGRCHTAVMEEFMHSTLVCAIWGYC